MSKKIHNKSFWHRIRFKYKLSFFNESTLEDVWSFRLSQLTVVAFFCLFAALLIILTSVIIIMTPIRNYLPGYLDVEVRKEILQNALRADSLEKKIAVQSKYLNNIEAILSGNISIDSIQKADSIPNTADNYDIPRGKNDSVFVKQFEEEEKYKINTLNPESSELSFRKPIKGVISDSFSDEKKHGGIDLTASAGEKVLATLPGTVVYAGYDNNFGNVITLQHENDFISIYKHNDRLLKKIGDKVTGGEAIAIIGNTGNFSTGAHLHFEIWHRGMQVDPTKFIRF